MSLFIFCMLLYASPSNQNIDAAKSIDDELYPLEKRIILMIQEESRRLKGLEKRREMRANMPSCPIEVDYWYNLNCA